MQSRSYNLTIGILCLLAGVVLIVKPESFTIWKVIAIGILYIFHGLLHLLDYIASSLDKEEWEYGRCNGSKARRHKKNGNVQFILWPKGSQKEVDGVGHLEDKWFDFDRSHWPNFRVSPLVNSNPPKPPAKNTDLTNMEYPLPSIPPSKPSPHS